MKIKKLKINNFGKLKDKEIELKDNLNIIFGKNEAGKSTILKYIVNSFYGISKNKKGKEYSDLERYKPWSGEDFSGRLTYELDNGKTYEVYRDFKKKNPKIFNEEMEDISKQFPIDKTEGNIFFYEQTKVDEELFLSTLVINQQETKLQKNEQGILMQKIANLVGTGEDNVSYKLAIDRINRRQLDEVGTQRSRERPINIIENTIKELEIQKQELKKYEEMQYDIENKENNILEEIKQIEERLQILNQYKIIFENSKLENEKLLLKENIKKQNIEKIRELDGKIDQIQLENKNALENKKVIKPKFISGFIIEIFLIFINILQFIFLKNNILNYIILGISVIISLILIINIGKAQKKYKKEIKVRQEMLKQNELVQEKIKLLQDEIINLEKNNEDISLEINLGKQKIEQEIINKTKDLSLENINSNNIYENINMLQNRLNNKKIELHSIELDKTNIIPKLEKLAMLEEKYVNAIEQKQNLEKLNMSIVLAKEILQECYEKMRHTVTPKFTQNLSKNIAEITDSKYTNVRFNDEKGLIVETQNGEYVPVAKLSVGTIEQLYLSLRLSMVEDLSSETLPIILDEVFAYFDDERLENFLKYVYRQYPNRQVLIFTCTNREIDILEKNGLKFNLIKI